MEEKGCTRETEAWERVMELAEKAIAKRDRMVSICISPDGSDSASVYPWTGEE